MAQPRQHTHTILGSVETLSYASAKVVVVAVNSQHREERPNTYNNEHREKGQRSEGSQVVAGKKRLVVVEVGEALVWFLVPVFLTLRNSHHGNPSAW